MHVLVVDDDESIREFVELALADEGYEVMTAVHGKAALDIIEEWQPDLILLDLRTPVMDGWEFSRVYKRLPGPHAPIIVITATSNPAFCAAEIDPYAVLAKPFDLDELLRLVNQCICRV
ncbi:MAG: response regulator [Chloroflexi bacterium]|nr:response regulator [Chloroflexota bacterium]